MSCGEATGPPGSALGCDRRGFWLSHLAVFSFTNHGVLCNTVFTGSCRCFLSACGWQCLLPFGVCVSCFGIKWFLYTHRYECLTTEMPCGLCYGGTLA